MQWNDDIIDELERSVGVRVNDAADYLRNIIKSNIGVDGPPRSNPGEFPHRDTTELQSGINQDFDPQTLTARVGTNVLHGAYLEFGTEKMRPRPWLFRSLEAETPEIVRIITNQPAPSRSTQ